MTNQSQFFQIKLHTDTDLATEFEIPAFSRSREIAQTMLFYCGCSFTFPPIDSMLVRGSGHYNVLKISLSTMKKTLIITQPTTQLAQSHHSSTV